MYDVEINIGYLGWWLSMETQDVILTFDWTKSDAETDFTVSTDIIQLLL